MPDMPDKKPGVAVVIAPKVGGVPEEHDETMEHEDGEPYCFDPPKGMDLEGKGPGETVEFVGEAMIGDDGKLELKTVNGMPLAGQKPEQKPKLPKPTGKAFADQLPDEDAMQEGMG